MPEQRGLRNKGATMRLGAYPCVLPPGIASRRRRTASTEISERHRHRYEFANDFRDQLANAGLVLERHVARQAARRDGGASDHPFFVGCQFHPEFKSRPASPHPLFATFVQAALEYRDARTASASRSPEELRFVN